MKLKQIILAFFTSLLVLGCSKNDPEPLDFNLGLGDLNIEAILVMISDDCDCVYPDGGCYVGHLLPEEEEERILELINQSPGECIYIISVDISGENVEGYIIWLNGYGVI